MGRNVAIHGFLAAAILILSTTSAAAEPSFKEMFTDPTDGPSTLVFGNSWF